MICLLAASRTGDQYIKKLETQVQGEVVVIENCVLYVVCICTVESKFFK